MGPAVRAAALLLAACLPEVASGGPPAPSAPDLDLLIKDAQRVQLEDTAAWTRFRFRRTIRTERLDENGAVRRSENLEFEVTPLVEGFDERLVRIDGRLPTAKEVDQYRRQGRFTRHYRTARLGEGGGAEGGGYSLYLFLKLSSYHYAGREVIDGVPCHRLDFEPQDHGELTGMEGHLAEAMAGSLWISEDGSHLARARVRTQRPVPVVMLFFKFQSLEIAFDGAPAGPGVWLPSRIEVRADARLLGWPIRRHSVFEYSAFAPAAAQ